MRDAKSIAKWLTKASRIRAGTETYKTTVSTFAKAENSNLWAESHSVPTV